MAKNQGNDQNRNAASSRDQQSQQSGQQGSQQQGNQQQGSQQQGSQQQGSQQQGSQQHGGQHASGGTPALDDLGGKQKGESAQDAAQAFDQQNSDSKKR
ncbi:hypothetical protein SRABI118_01612 [Massilia sp. Bi118]|nr:hypothetical protein SRABI118_01612 [Massilia sp. Bi118]